MSSVDEVLHLGLKRLHAPRLLPQGHVSIDVKVFDLIADFTSGAPVLTRLEAVIRPFSAHGCFEALFLVFGGVFEDVVANIDLACDFGLGEAMVDNDKEALGCHCLSNLFGELGARLGSFMVATKIDFDQVDIF